MIEVSVWTCTARDLVSASEDYRCLRFDVIPSLKPTRSFLLGRRIPAALKFESEVCAIQRSVSAGFACGQGNATRHVGAYPRYQAQILVLVGLSSGVLVHCPGANWTLESVGSDSSRTARLTKRLPNFVQQAVAQMAGDWRPSSNPCQSDPRPRVVCPWPPPFCTRKRP